MKLMYRLVLPALLIAGFSCDEKLEDINKNPNTLPRANDSEVLTSAIGYMGYVLDADVNENSLLWSQYYTWGAGVQLGNRERFLSVPGDYNGYWGRSYSDALTDLKYLTKSSSAAYRGVARILEAHVYQGLVDHFGDIPYSEAVSGDEGILTPKYDDGAEVYASLVLKLDQALEELEFAQSQGQTIGTEDLIFEGDLDNWVRFANSLKLRILMRTSETDPQQAAIEELISSGTFIETLAQMPQVPFSAVVGNQNPVYVDLENNVGFFYVASNATLNVLDNLSDPRVTAFYSLATAGTYNGEIHGIDQGSIVNEPAQASIEEYSSGSDLSYGIDNDVILMSAWEVWFLRAEAAARYGTTDDEASAFNSAVVTNFNYLGVGGGAAYVTSLNYDAGDPLDTRIDIIAVQKWISMNGTQEDEGWIETRRFDRPASRLFTNGIFQDPVPSVLPDGTFPASWLIPASEVSLNPNTPAQREIVDRLFWDN